MPIQILDSKTIAQIAAGEVIERPASVVKELVENSLDAGAARITVEVQGGGVAMLRVTDDGSGITESEVETAFARHATSKISRLVDLETVMSLGFRGEALPSIAAVAEVELLTCVQDAAAGTYIRLQDGSVVEKIRRGRSPGTTVTVHYLFRKMPARLKFLKSAATENSHIAGVISQYALAFPEVSFTLLIEGKQTLNTPGTRKLIDAVVRVYGAEVAGCMLEVNQTEWESGRVIKVCGLAGSPEVARSNRNYLSFFVNRRWITNRLLSWAVEEAYQGLLMQGKHPIAVINLTVPPSELDVNIHPAKAEIKFSDERAVFTAVQRAVRQVLVRTMPVPQIEEVAPAYAPGRLTHPVISPPSPHPVEKPSGHTAAPLFTAASALPVLRVLGQLSQCYIIAEGADGLYVIDQHAAHERILYEEIQAQRAGLAVAVQGLLPPVPFEVNPKQAALLGSRLAGLAGYGFQLETFGERVYLVRAVPSVLAKGDWAAALREFLDNMLIEGQSNWEQNLMKSLACHGAVKAGQILNDESIRGLIRQLENTKLPQTCPHGRPTMVHLTGIQIQREFGRT